LAAGGGLKRAGGGERAGVGGEVGVGELEKRREGDGERMAAGYKRSGRVVSRPFFLLVFFFLAFPRRRRNH